MKDATQSSNYNLTLMLYILYVIAIFSAGILGIIALIINYIKRKDVEGTLFESHFTWQIRTFWWYIFWNIMSVVPLMFLLFSNPQLDTLALNALVLVALFMIMIACLWIWIVYRAIRGIIYLNENKPMYTQ